MTLFSFETGSESYDSQPHLFTVSEDTRDSWTRSIVNKKSIKKNLFVKIKPIFSTRFEDHHNTSCQLSKYHPSQPEEEKWIQSSNHYLPVGFTPVFERSLGQRDNHYQKNFEHRPSQLRIPTDHIQLAINFVYYPIGKHHSYLLALLPNASQPVRRLQTGLNSRKITYRGGNGRS